MFQNIYMYWVFIYIKVLECRNTGDIPRWVVLGYDGRTDGADWADTNGFLLSFRRNLFALGVSFGMTRKNPFVSARAIIHLNHLNQNLCNALNRHKIKPNFYFLPTTALNFSLF
jgi:hypothetical protein